MGIHAVCLRYAEACGVKVSGADQDLNQREAQLGFLWNTHCMLWWIIMVPSWWLSTWGSCNVGHWAHTNLLLADTVMVGSVHRCYTSAQRWPVGSYCWSNLHHITPPVPEWNPNAWGKPLFAESLFFSTDSVLLWLISPESGGFHG
jgi:hypothetical protein